ncbi:MAG: hypothetical protein MUC74_06085 [Ideonella sp.]|jgi:hypothetical protein|nr:hypothetical protein [Ideonella sp.]
MTPRPHDVRSEPPRRLQRGFEAVSGWGPVLWVLSAAVAIVATMIALHTAIAGGQLPRDTHHLMCVALWVLLLPWPGLALGRWQQQRNVWVARVAPTPMLRSLRSGWGSCLAATAAVAVLPVWLVAALAPPPGGAPGFMLWAAGLMLGTLAAGTLASAAWRGLVASVWLLPGMAIIVAGAVVMNLDAERAAWQAADGWRALILLLLVLSPAATLWLLRDLLTVDGRTRLGHALRATEHSPQARWGRLRAEWQAHFRSVDGGSGLALLGGLSGQLPQQFWNRQPEGLMFMPWDSTVTPLGIYRLLFFTLLALSMISSRTLHWRCLLAPGAAWRARLGVEVAASTWLLVVLVLTVLFGAAGALTIAWSDDGEALWQSVPDLLLRYLPVLLLELALACALAALLRGWAGSYERAALALLGIGIAVALGLLALWILTGHSLPVLLHRDARYVVGLLLLTLALLLWNRRIWRRADFGALMRAARRKPQLHPE